MGVVTNKRLPVYIFKRLYTEEMAAKSGFKGILCVYVGAWCNNILSFLQHFRPDIGNHVSYVEKDKSLRSLPWLS